VIDKLLNYSSAELDAGTLTFAAPWNPLWLLVLSAVIAAALAISLWMRRKTLSTPKLATIWALQTLVAVMLLSLLWRPALKLATPSAGDNTIAVLLDTSASMQVGVNGNDNRYQQAHTVVSELLPELEKNFTVNTATFGTSLNWQPQWQSDSNPATAVEPRSNITTALSDVLDQAQVNPLSAIVIATDGSDNSNYNQTEFWNLLESSDIPVYTIGVGRTELADDIEIVNVDLNAEATPGSVQTARVTLQHGNQPSLTLKVLSGDDIVALEEQTLPRKPGQTTISVDIDANDIGLQQLSFEAVSGSTDSSPQNNFRNRLLHVKDESRKVLYFEGEPRWEYKFMRRALHKSPGLTLVTILRTTPNKFYRQGVDSPTQHADGFPQTKAELYSYDAVIIGNVESVSLKPEQQQILHDYVSERGGTLLMLAGDKALSDGGWQSSPIARALPAKLINSAQPTYSRSRAKAVLTRGSVYSPITSFDDDDAVNRSRWAELPETADFQRLGDIKPGASVLLNASINNKEYPLLLKQRYGAGSSYLLATSGTWRWQMQLPSEDQHHETFWRQLLQTVAASAQRPMQIATDRQTYSDEDQILIAAKIYDREFNPLTNGAVNATLIAPDGNRTEILLDAAADEAGRYQATINAPQTGSWQIDIAANNSAGETLHSTTKWIYREDGTAEHFALAQNAAFLKRVSASSNGIYYTTDTAAELPTALRTASTGIVSEKLLPLWNAPLFFLLLLGLKLLEWVLRLAWGRL